MNLDRQSMVIRYLPIYGCIAAGLCYCGVGTIAILSFFKIREGGADENSMLAILNEVFVGRILLWIIMVGTGCYVVWRVYESITDPYKYGKDIRGLGKRVGIALSTVADILIVNGAIRVLLGVANIQQTGEPAEERQFVHGMLAESWGAPVVMSMGIVVLLAAIVQLVYGIGRGYQERLNIGHYSKPSKASIRVLAWVGFCSRGVIVGITGFFLLKAGVTRNSEYVVNTDKAFDFIGDEAGGVFFILTAIGTVCYGIFMFIQGIAYDHDKN